MSDDEKRVNQFLSKTRTIKNGIVLEDTTGKRNWWTEKWLELVEKLESGNRLTQGRTVAKNGQVIYIKIQKGFIFAKVQGDRLKPYQVRIEANKISEKIWGEILTDISANAFLVSKLYTADLPEKIAEMFAARNTSLIPLMEQDLRAGCTCADWANPCKHSAAVLYIIADMIEKDPLLLFKLRGKTKEEIYEIFRVKRKTLADDKSVIKKVGVRIITNGYVDRKETDLYGSSSLDTLVSELSRKELLETTNTEKKDTSIANIWSEVEDAPFVINGENLKKLLENSYQVAKRLAKKKLATIQE